MPSRRVDGNLTVHSVKPSTLSVGEVVSGGFCVGCGGCSVASNGAIAMQRNREQTFQPRLSDSPGADDASGNSAVCPFTGLGPDESAIANSLYDGTGCHSDERTGYHRSLYAGRIADTKTVLDSSSGGLTSWLLAELLQRGMVDGVIHVGSGDGGDDDALFAYRVSDNVADLHGRKKSQYYSISFADVLLSIRGNGKRYAFVGVPCFVKARRLLQAQDAELAEQIAFTVGLVCGHLKSGAFAEVMAHQVGVRKQALDTVDFRLKNSNAPANAYDFGARDRLGGWHSTMSRTLLGGNWGHALFQLKACDFCDDIFAETADICFGDAWLPQYESEWRGTNVVLCRSQQLQPLLEDGLARGAIVMDAITVADAVQSQAGNFRHRREGLSLRLEDAMARGEKVPRKRVRPGSVKLPALRRAIVRKRQEMAAASHVLYREARDRTEADLSSFFPAMQRYVAEMDALYRCEDNRRVRTILRRALRAPRALWRRAQDTAARRLSR